jgi:N-acetylmuramic acid 6-phosphate (MurNAc-6-P) etherase
MNKKEIKELYLETNEKFVGRMEGMLYDICGCDLKRASIILKECLKRNKQKQNDKNKN